MAVAQDGKITKQFLKTRSGEFTTESIHSLCLHQASVNDLGCVGECSGLERLDLSKNDVTSLQRLAGLNQLTVLNLSANRITSLEGLQTLENLQTLNLAGNLIGRLDSLICLMGLGKLVQLRLQDKISGLSNPVCQHGQYFEEVKKMLPNLVILDGERLEGKGSEFSQLCRQIDVTLHQACRDNVQHPPVHQVSPWLPPDYWQTSDTFQSSSLCDAEQQIADLLASCKRTIEQSDPVASQ